MSTGNEKFIDFIRFHLSKVCYEDHIIINIYPVHIYLTFMNQCVNYIMSHKSGIIMAYFRTVCACKDG